MADPTPDALFDDNLLSEEEVRIVAEETARHTAQHVAAFERILRSADAHSKEAVADFTRQVYLKIAPEMTHALRRQPKRAEP